MVYQFLLQFRRQIHLDFHIQGKDNLLLRLLQQKLFQEQLNLILNFHLLVHQILRHQL